MAMGVIVISVEGVMVASMVGTFVVLMEGGSGDNGRFELLRLLFSIHG